MATFVLNYMNRFVCLGGVCPDICCRDWPVHLSRQDLDILLAAVRQDEAGRGDILGHILVDAMAEHRQFTGRIRWNEANECPFLDGQRLCDLYKRLGGIAQPAVCSLFPRSFVKWGERLELSGAMSCPEVVRLLLDSDDPLIWQARPDITHHPRMPPQDPCGGREQSPWCQQAMRVRNMLCHFITQTTYPLASRLFFCGLFAQQTFPDFVSDGSSPAAENQLQQALQQLGDASIPAILHQHWSSIPVSLPLAQAIIDAIADYGAGSGEINNPFFGRLIQEVMTGYGSTHAAAIHETMSLRLYALTPASRQWLDQSFDRFAHHFLLQESILHYRDVPSYVRRLVVAVMVCRFLFFGMLGQVESTLSQEEQLIKVRQTLMTVFFRFSKSFSHYRLDLSQLDDLPKLLMFLRLW
ncbi:MAG: hypothetical protein G8345_01255 [Magnetococcales bacterium]|nr:flagellin lysine-N-methylase [Magnetococcales bacterium]NGZ25498.1 hypothetical protein [Magnetococcales bacterium]